MNYEVILLCLLNFTDSGKFYPQLEEQILPILKEHGICHLPVK